MDTSKLKKFAQYARRSLIEQVESKLKLVLAEESEARREYPQAVAELEKKLTEQGAAGDGEQQLIEQVAYTWFNRFCALRFMDVNQYNRIMVISPLAGQFQPEILAEAKAGHIDEGMVNEKAREKIFGLLSGSVASRDGQAEAFRLLIVAVCNDLHRVMPYLFERIEDYTELLMPDDLLSGNSILAYTREAMTPEACESVESIGWLYQFYISEKKDEVFDGLKKNKKITPENIPAATQLFTPHWIVRYLVENSLGRLWMLNNPSSKVIEQMDYYIKPVEAETDFLRISSPEEIKICDPACGSGHMLTYAYDLLYSIYLDAGYDPSDIPELILTNNLYGIEIDERAAELAAFALTMKAIKGDPHGDGNNRRRFFRNPVEPNICRLEKVSFTEEELDSYINFVGKDLFTQDLRATLKEFEEADNFGSLIQPTLKNPDDALAALETKDVSGELFLAETHKSVLRVLEQADYLSQKYHVVVANPPYKKKADLNGGLQSYLEASFRDGKYDLYQAFILRNLNLANVGGLVGMITMQGWMFAPRYEAIRAALLSKSTIRGMAQFGERAFDSIGGEVVSTTAFVLGNCIDQEFKGDFVQITAGQNEAEKEADLTSAVAGHAPTLRFTVSSSQFEVIPGNPLIYWAADSIRDLFSNNQSIAESIVTREGLATGSNETFLREWHEVSTQNVGFGIQNNVEAQASGLRWFPYVKGGGSRRWYGNIEHFVNWFDDGAELRNFKDERTGRVRSHNYNGDFGFRSGFTWSGISSNDFAIRAVPKGFMFDAKGPMGFENDTAQRPSIQGFLNSRVSSFLLRMLAPTLDFKLTHVLSLPFIAQDNDAVVTGVSAATQIAKSDWDAYETSWDFTSLPLLQPSHRVEMLEATYTTLRAHWQSMTDDMQRLEEENNRTFIDAYGLQGDLTPEVPLNEITLTCNPAYRYGVKGTEEEREARLRADTMAEFLSYAVGCMFGRYSLDKEGLILANQGDTLENYLKQVPQPSFMPDDDNVIPLIDFDGDWFEDDITERFKEFLKVTFGEEHFAENLAFIEEALGGGDGKRKDIKKFFLKDFYADHVKRYKKRPIYWMFSSPKGSFNALIYMHRYNKDTVSIVLNDYLREFRTKLQARKESHEQIEVSASASAKEKTQAMKAIQKINKALDEINDYEHDTLYPLAGKPPEIDLDDGVKHNYPLFGKALKKITGLS